MNIGIIGSGGREHSICFKLKKSKNVSKIYCIPGNAGTSEICENINLPIENFDEIYKTVKEKKIQLSNIYSSPKDLFTLERAGRWSVVQIVKLFLGMPIIPGR